MNYSFASHLDCPICHSEFSVESIHQLCHCGSPLLVKYHLQELKSRLTKDEVSTRKDFSLWRYHELLPVLDKNHVVTLGEGFTPLIKTENIGRCYSIKNLYMKMKESFLQGPSKHAALRLAFLKRRNSVSAPLPCRQTEMQAERGHFIRPVLALKHMW
ncbi:hypothetical protein SAMN05443252_106211 [Bacillus sp. OV322]|nr:hypothetical protein SAMN05443252_106211 [Bacillus sp. OV322]